MRQPTCHPPDARNSLGDLSVRGVISKKAHVLNSKNIAILQAQLADGVPTFAYLYGGGTAWETRLHGITEKPEEIDTGVWAASAAVRDSTGIVAALTVQSPLVRAPAAMQDQLLRRVRDAAGEINEALRAAHR